MLLSFRERGGSGAIFSILNSEGMVPLAGNHLGPLSSMGQSLVVYPWVEKLVGLATGRVETVLIELSSLKSRCPIS